MMSIQSRLLELKEALTGITEPVYHFRRPANGVKSGYIVFAENGEDSDAWNDNHKTEQAISVSVDYYTKVEFDAIADFIQEALNSIRCGWRLEAVQYEDETNLIHYTWEVNLNG
jgi:hypothetical protein